MRSRSVSRSDLRRALVVNALASPVNVLVPTAVLIAGLLIGAPWLALVALICWLALAAHTFFDERAAERVGARVHASARATKPANVSPGAFTPLIGGRVKAAVAARAAIHEAIAAGRSPLPDVSREVDALVAAMEADAVRAQRIHQFLAGQESAASLERRIEQETHDDVRAALESKQRAFARLRERLSRLMAEMDQVVATLQTIQAEIFAADEVEEQALATRVSELRENVALVAAGLEEAYADTRVRQT
jgi:uncharacterized protein YhaN